MDEEIIHKAKKSWFTSEAILIGTGAGMGVDSGLPVFRGENGFWKAYPPLAKLGIQFEEMANPRWFRDDPRLAWGFYGHRFNLYRKTIPHRGFEILVKKFKDENIPTFIFSSNVDGQFQKAGFPENLIMECHGSIMHLQCMKSCGYPIWPIDQGTVINIDSETLLAEEPLPACPNCKSIARPNILMFSDFEWDHSRTTYQRKRMEDWLEDKKQKKLLVIEIGAGSDIPTVRLTCEEIFQSIGDQFIRINPIESECNIKNSLSFSMGAEKALKIIAK